MRKLVLFSIALLVLAALVPMAAAAPRAQFAGCADETAREAGAHYRALDLNGFTLTITVIGVDEFDPQITILDDAGETVACNDDGRDVEFTSVSLPTVEAGPAETTAQISVRVPGEGRANYDIYITNATGEPGEFVMLYQGAEVFGATDIDDFELITTVGQVEEGVPVGIYAVNADRANSSVDLEIRLSTDNFEAFCSKSSSDSLCDANSEDLSDAEYFLSLSEEEAEAPRTFTGDDVMLFFEAGGEPGTVNLTVGSYQEATFGPYILMIHSGTGALAE